MYKWSEWFETDANDSLSTGMRAQESHDFVHAAWASLRTKRFGSRSNPISRRTLWYLGISQDHASADQK